MAAIQTYAELRRTRSPSAIRHGVATGALIRLDHGIYGVGGAVPSHLDRLRALQRRDPAAVASHGSAALLLGILDEAPDALHITVPHAAVRRSGTSLVVHRSRRPVRVIEVSGIRTTDPVRTVLDQARWLPHPDGLVVADAALQRGVVDGDALRAAVVDVRGLDGAARARLVAERCRRGAESPMETRLRDLLVSASVPEPVLQHVVVTAIGKVRLDLAWPAQRLAVEYDGYAWHSGRVRFGADRRRWRALTDAGWELHAVTASDLPRRAEIATAVLAALRRRTRPATGLGG